MKVFCCKVSNFYIAGKNKADMQELCFYAKVGAYNIGDILTLENLIKHNELQKLYERTKRL